METAALVADHLRGLGFDDVRTGIAHTGVVAVLRGGRPGPVVAVRADMDALPVTEATDLPFASTKRTTLPRAGGRRDARVRSRHPHRGPARRGVHLTAATVPSLTAAVGGGNVALADPWMAGEDFSRFANEVPGFFFMLGARKPGTVSGDHHSPTFRADDGALAVGMRAMATVLRDYLERGASGADPAAR